MSEHNVKYETVIGLETHVQLLTNTKVFCGCPTKFGAEPNSQVCPVCLGLPGALPVLNTRAFRHSIKVALALRCNIQKRMKFDRKNYYYPDLPKNYQISQYDMPLAFNGFINIKDESGNDKRIGITRAHMEEDAGKLIHDEKKPYSYVDLNRTGTPLLEIVSEPDIRSPEEAYRYLTILKRVVKYLGVSDCNMEEASLRCDANISLRKKGDKKFGNKVEIKNLNSFKAVRDALLYEEDRQGVLLDDGALIVSETRLWDEKKNITSSMRSKEEAHDYRYFPEPDLVPFDIPTSLIDEIKEKMPELPEEKKERFQKKYNLPEADMALIIDDRDTADFFEEVNDIIKDPRVVSNWVKGEILKHVNESKKSLRDLGIRAGKLAAIINLARDGALSGLAAKEVLEEYINTSKDPALIVSEKGLRQISDKGELDNVIDKVIAENAKSVNDFKNGKENALSFLIGQVMKLSKGKANPKVAADMLRKKLKEK